MAKTYIALDAEFYWDRDLHELHRAMDPASQRRAVAVKKVMAAGVFQFTIDEEGRVSTGEIGSWSEQDWGDEEGVVSKVFPADGLMEPAMELAARLANMPTQSMALIKYLVHKSLDMSFEDSLALAHVAQEQVRRTDDHKEAVQAFIEKRQPKFTGR